MFPAGNAGVRLHGGARPVAPGPGAGAHAHLLRHVPQHANRPQSRGGGSQHQSEQSQRTGGLLRQCEWPLSCEILLIV